MEMVGPDLLGVARLSNEMVIEILLVTRENITYLLGDDRCRGMIQAEWAVVQ